MWPTHPRSYVTHCTLVPMWPTHLRSYVAHSPSFLCDPLHLRSYVIHCMISQHLLSIYILSMNISQCNDWMQHGDPGDKSKYTWIMQVRLSVILFSTFFLLVNILVIIRKKQYKFNTIKLFMFVQIFYVLALVSVTPHRPSFNLQFYQYIPYSNAAMGQASYSYPDFLSCIVVLGEEFYTAIEGFTNITCYTISYWFAVCITMYINHLLENSHKKFMRKKGTLIFIVIFAIVAWNIVPFGLTFFQGVPFSFGPTGYRLLSQGEFLLYAGIVNRNGELTSQILVIAWMWGCPMLLFVYHIYLLLSNRRSIKRLMQLDQISPRQFFIIKSGRLSFVIFFVQILNVSKLAFNFALDNSVNAADDLAWIQVLLFVVNVVFDLMPLLLIAIYFKYYYKEGTNLQERSEFMDQSLIASFGGGSIV